MAIIAELPATAAPTDTTDKRLNQAVIRWPGPGGRTLKGYMAIGRKLRGRQPAVVVLAPFGAESGEWVRRIALAGFVALAPDLQGVLARPAAPAPLDAAALPDAVATVNWLRASRYATGRIALIGMGSGAALAERIDADARILIPTTLGEARLQAAGNDRSVATNPWDDILAFLKEQLR